MTEVLIPTIEQVPVESLKIDGKNPNHMSDRQREALKQNFLKFGFIVPIITNKDLLVADGQHRLEVAREMGMSQVPVIRLDVPEVERKMLREILNKLRGVHDKELDFEEYEAILAEAGDLKEFSGLLGITEMACRSVIDAFKGGVRDDAFDVLAAYEAMGVNVKEGDVYRLGRHLIICGDSTKEETIAKLMGPELADLIWTDPPYNVGYDYSKVGLGKKKRQYVNLGKIFNDDSSCEDFEDFLFKAFRGGVLRCKPDLTVYCCYASNNYTVFRRGLERAGLKYRQTIIWLKEAPVFALGEDFHREFEAMMYMKRGKPFVNKVLSAERDVWGLSPQEFQDSLDVWFAKRNIAEYIHPTQKPIELVAKALRKSTIEGAIVLDMFGGSGTTLMACEQMGRSARIVELDPKYVMAMILRWEKWTNEKAEKVIS